MKKFLFLILSITTLFGSANSFAQSFTRFRDTVWTNFTGTSSMNVYNNVSATSSPVVLKWKVVNSNFPADWLAANPGMCDNALCYGFNGSTGLWPAGNVMVSDTYRVAGVHDFHLVIDLSSASVTSRGMYYVTAKLWNIANPNDSLYSTFAISNFPASVATTSKNVEDISLYPNPTSNDINVKYDAAYDIKTISVYNIIGKVMAIYKPLTDNSANLSLENVPAGIYFVRLANSQGQVIVTKKFTKQ